MSGVIAKKSGGPRELIPAGTHVARCYALYQIGTVTETVMGQTKEIHKIRLVWELPFEVRAFDEAKGPQPMSIGKDYTLSLSDKSKLRADLRSWRGRDFTPEELEGFDVTSVVGIPCILNILHKPSKKDPTISYEEISAITPLHKGLECPPMVNERLVFSFQSYSPETLEKVPEYWRNKIKTSKEYLAMSALAPAPLSAPTSQAGQPAYDDDLPF